MSPLFWLSSAACRNAALVGGKAANLSQLHAIARKLDFPVPPGFCIAAHAENLTPALAEQIVRAYTQLGQYCGQLQPAVAVRSSAVAEDGPKASFAGQHDSYLNVIGAAAVLEAVQKCWASAHQPRALAYRRQHGLPAARGLAVLVQLLIPADAAFVAFSADPNTGQRDRVVINAAWGLGESLVSGSTTPDLYVTRKHNGQLLAQQIGAKARMTILAPHGQTQEVAVPQALQREPALTPAQVLRLTTLVRTLEATLHWPVDVEGAVVGDQLYLLQCRPITTLAPRPQRPPTPRKLVPVWYVAH